MSAVTSDKKVNVAVVGLGFMGVVHLKAYLANPLARVVAVCDSVRLPVNGVLQGVAGNVKKVEDLHLGTHVKAYRALEEVTADPEVELIDLCTPTPLHAQQAIASLKTGKSVFCEKPLARTAKDARDILRVLGESGGFLMPAMCMRFWPGWSWLKQAVEERRYGKVLSARFRRLSEMPGWSKQGTYKGGNDLGGALFDLHIHDVDFVQFLFGRPKAVYATGVTSESGSIDHVVAQYHYPGGPAVCAEGSWLYARGFTMAYTLLCEKATLDYDLSRGSDALQVTELGTEPKKVELAGPDGYSLEIDYALQCALQKKAPAIVTAQDGLSALEICEAEEKSVQSGTVVSL